MNPASWALNYFDNRRTFNSEKVVESYSASVDLQNPEKTILELMRPQLFSMRMLDLGVGTGRTTRHFEPLVKEYVGVDYAPTMVNYCQTHFSGSAGKRTFLCADARDLEKKVPGKFDFILFSYNGLDFVGQEDRLKILKEVRSLLNPGGRFCFSTHNLYALTRYFGTGLGFWKSLAMRTIFLALNGGMQGIESRPWAVLRDGAQAFRIRNYCIKPEAQLGQLTESGFRNIQVFSLADGAEFTGGKGDYVLPDRWLYFLCQS